MKSQLKQLLKLIFPKQVLHYQCYERLIKNKESYLYLMGWIQSLEQEKPIDVDGQPIPWMNFPTVSLMKERLNDNLTLFEFGSGYSTHFFAHRVKEVTSVEYNKSWFQRVKSDMPENVELIFQNNDIDGDYCRVISTTNKHYDIVIVDGRDRVNCIKKSISALSSSGVIFLDDSDRKRYKEGIDFAKENGFRALNIAGLKATGSGIDQTTILYRDNNCFGI